MQRMLRKENGIHYTPVALAGFLADRMVPHVKHVEPLKILDPACGDGELLAALVDSLSQNGCSPASVSLTAYDIDKAATAETRKRMAAFQCGAVKTWSADFLDSLGAGSGLPGTGTKATFDCVISNPPYVRTQVLGGDKSQRLAREFGLSGRVDLYQVFTVAMSRVLKPGGVLGLLTSNRFLTVKSGSEMRRQLSEHFELREIFDLGDTKLFEAAVLPVVVIAVKKEPAPERIANTSACRFSRIYRALETSEQNLHIQSTDQRPARRHPRDGQSAHRHSEILNAVAGGRKRTVSSGGEKFRIERGSLKVNEGGVWTLQNPASERWLKQLRSRQFCAIGEIGTVKVGIKTTADKVFVSRDWSETSNPIPEDTLLHPMITHHVAGRWSVDSAPSRRVLYPYDMKSASRKVISASAFPDAMRYLLKHRKRLESRKYLIDAGRKWYEIWVPHQPRDWAAPKIVWPDIAKEPTFFLDTSGAIVGGDCYWLKLLPDVDADWLYLIPGVANSRVATKFYDTLFHNKLYAGRRRFMTQYVKEFPLPDIESPEARKIVKTVKQLIGAASSKSSKLAGLEKKLELQVEAAFFGR